MCAIAFVISSVLKAVTSICIALCEVGELFAYIFIIGAVGDGLLLALYTVLPEMSGQREFIIIVLYLITLAAFIGFMVAVVGGLGGLILTFLMRIMERVFDWITDASLFLSNKSDAMYEYFLGVLVDKTKNMGT